MSSGGLEMDPVALKLIYSGYGQLEFFLSIVRNLRQEVIVAQRIISRLQLYYIQPSSP